MSAEASAEPAASATSAELSEFRVSYSKAGLHHSRIVLVLAGFALDYALYPERLTEFFIARLTVAVLSCIVLDPGFSPKPGGAM